MRDRTIYPVEIKKSASPRREWAQQFSVLDRLDPAPAEGAVVCLRRERWPIAEGLEAVPVGVV